MLNYYIESYNLKLDFQYDKQPSYFQISLRSSCLSILVGSMRQRDISNSSNVDIIVILLQNILGLGSWIEKIDRYSLAKYKFKR